MIMIYVFGGIAVIAATIGLYFQFRKDELAYAISSYIVTVISLGLTIFSIVHPTKSSTEKTTPSPVSTFQSTDAPEPSDEKVDVITAPPEVTDPPDIPNQIQGQLSGEDSREESYRAVRSGIYRFDFEIDDVNKRYSFHIIDSKQEEISTGYSSDLGLTVGLEAGMDYILRIEHGEEDEDVQYGITINVPDEIQNIESQLIQDGIRYRDQEKEYTYLASKSGNYRFDFDIDDVNKKYGFYIFDTKNEELLRKSSADEGGTLELSAGQTYKIIVTQEEELPQYSITIHEPNEPKVVNENKIKGNIEFTNQTDIYYYTAPRTGVYRFDLGINDVNYDYSFIILDHKREKIVDVCASDEGKTIELEKGEKYELQIVQNSGVAKYNIQIHVPNQAKQISGGVAKGNVTYVDQQDIYYYTAKKSGVHYFSFSASNSENSYYVSMHDSKNKVVFDDYYSEDTLEIELKKNQKYKLYIQYSRGFGKYTVSIKK